MAVSQQDGRFCRLELPSIIRRPWSHAAVAGDPDLAAKKKQAPLRVFVSPDAAADATSIGLSLRGLAVGKLALVLHSSTAGAATAI